MRFRFIPFLALLLMATASQAQPATQPPPQLEFKIEPTFEDIKEMTFAGLAAYAEPGSPRFPELWNDGFRDMVGGEPGGEGGDFGLEKGKYAYGLELFPPSFEKKRKFTYMACYSVVDPTKVPVHLLQRTVPASKYAIFKVPGGIPGLGQTFNFIYSRWLPESGYDRAFPFDMERYDLKAEAAKGGNMVIEVLVPITPRVPPK